LLATFTVRSAAMVIRRQSRQKRGAGRVVGESAFSPRDRTSAAASGLTTVLSNEPTPEDVARVGDDLDHLLSKLDHAILVGSRCGGSKARRVTKSVPSSVPRDEPSIVNCD
jgi:hypothetical protein